MTPQELGDIAKSIDGFSGRTLNYALVLAAIGTVTMALIELVKAVSRGRRFFHRWMIGRWINHADGVRTELLRLAVGGVENATAFYDQPSEKMLGQIQAAANVALDSPTVFPAFYGFLARGSAHTANKDDGERWLTFARRMSEGAFAAPQTRATFEAESRESTQARARLGNLITRKLDALQTIIDHRWAFLNQFVAVLGGGSLLYWLLPAVGVPAPTRLMFALVGGLVAPGGW